MKKKILGILLKICFHLQEKTIPHYYFSYTYANSLNLLAKDASTLLGDHSLIY